DKLVDVSGHLEWPFFVRNMASRVVDDELRSADVLLESISMPYRHYRVLVTPKYQCRQINRLKCPDRLVKVGGDHLLGRCAERSVAVWQVQKMCIAEDSVFGDLLFNLKGVLQ